MNCILFPLNFTSRDYDIFFIVCWYAKQFWYLDSRNYIEMLYFKISKFFAEALKTCFNNEILEFYKSLEITNNDDIMTVGVIKSFRNIQILKFSLNINLLILS